MIDELQYIVRGKDFPITNKLHIHNPTLAELCDYGEQQYMADLSALILRPYDAMVALDDIGLNYQKISNYEFFMMTADSLIGDTNIFLPGIDFTLMRHGVNPENGEPILYDATNGVIVDRFAYDQITEFIRAIHFLRADVEFDVGNEMARRQLIKKKRRELKKKKSFEPQYPSVISSLVNNANFHYDYDSIMNLHVSQLWDAFYRINKLMNYQNTMVGVYTGNIDSSKIDRSTLSWFERIDLNATQKIDESKAITTT